MPPLTGLAPPPGKFYLGPLCIFQKMKLSRLISFILRTPWLIFREALSQAEREVRGGSHADSKLLPQDGSAFGCRDEGV